MGTRGRIWAGTLLLAVLSQFAGPLSGAASAFVGPVWLPVSQEQPVSDDAAGDDETAVQSAECQDEAGEQTEAMAGASGLGLLSTPVLVSQPCEPAPDTGEELEGETAEDESPAAEPTTEPEPLVPEVPVELPAVTSLLPAAPSAAAVEEGCAGGTPADAPACVTEFADCATTAEPAGVPICAGTAQAGLMAIAQNALGCEEAPPAGCVLPPPCTPGDGGCVYDAVAAAACTAAGCTDDLEAALAELGGCVTWGAGAPAVDDTCVQPAVVSAVCAAQGGDECLLENESLVALLGTAEACAGNPGGCRASIQKLAVNALCDVAARCIDGLEDCVDQDCAPILWDEACEAGAAACTPAVRELRVCLEGANPNPCQPQGFWVRWIGTACAETPAKSAACPVEVIVAPPLSATSPVDGSPIDLSATNPIANGSSQFPYRSISAAIAAVVTRANSGNPGSPAVQGPIKVSPGVYKETNSITPPSGSSGVPIVIQRVGSSSSVATVERPNGAVFRLLEDHTLVFKGGPATGRFTVIGAPAIDGPVGTTSVSVDRPRMYVGHGASVDVGFGVTDVALPEQVRYEFILDGPGVSKDTVHVQTWNGSAWSDLAFDAASATPTVKLFESAPDAAVAVPLNRSASVRVVGTTTMGLTMTGRLVGAMTHVVYATDTTDYIEVAEVPDGPVAPPAKPRTQADDTPPLVRLAGEDRAATAAAVSRSSFPDGADAVFVATGASYADALAGGPAAAKSGSPVVLVERDRVPEATRTELERLDPAQVRLLGGTGAISAEVEEELAAMGAEVSRLRGDSRYATAAAVSAAHFDAGVPVAYIASGEGFADALSGGAAAAALGGPVLLVQPDAVPAATDQELRRLAPGRIVVLGGTSAVSDDVVAELRAHSDEVRRVSGADRYATSAAVSRDAFSGTQETIFVATGASFPDALAGVPAAGALGAPLMLVEPDRLPAEVAAELDRLRPKRIVILGGERSVSQRLERELRSYQIP